MDNEFVALRVAIAAVQIQFKIKHEEVAEMLELIAADYARPEELENV